MPRAFKSLSIASLNVIAGDHRSSGQGIGIVKFKHRLQKILAPIIYGQSFNIVTPKLAGNWPQRRFLRQLLTRSRIDCVIDVGANIGQYGNELRMIGYRGHILSFEPVAGCYAQLAARAAKDPKWQWFHYALGSEAGSAMINEMELSVFNSFREPYSVETRIHDHENKIVRQSEVQIRRLDDMLPRIISEHSVSHVFLKMDTQGFDLEVFAGARSFLPKIVAMQSELPVKRIYKDSIIWRDALAVYEAAGFTLSALFPVNPKMEELIEMDCYLYNSHFME